MVNYSNGKIYKLVNDVDDKIYIGSTCNRLSHRKNLHKGHSKRKPNRVVYKHLNSIGWENVDIILVENFNCKSKNELHARERHYIDLLKPSLNRVIPLRTLQEWCEDNKELIKQNKKKYYDENKEKFKQYGKKYRDENKEKIKAREKKYRDDNIELIKEQNKKYYDDNKERLSKKYKQEKLTCSYCNKTFRKNNTTQHIKTNKHIKNFKDSYKLVFDEEFDGEITTEDY
jgi:hypothetical protein